MPPTLEDCRETLRLCAVPAEESDHLDEAIAEQDGRWAAGLVELICESPNTVTAEWRYDTLEVLYRLECACRLHGIQIHVDETEDGILYVQADGSSRRQTLAPSEGAELTEVVSALAASLPKSVSIMGLTGLDGQQADSYAYIVLPSDVVVALIKLLEPHFASVFTAIDIEPNSSGPSN